jgi:hypothetical protein
LSFIKLVKVSEIDFWMKDLGHRKDLFLYLSKKRNKTKCGREVKKIHTDIRGISREALPRIITRIVRVLIGSGIYIQRMIGMSKER